MYSLLFVSFLKPQYKKYCDLVAETGNPLPYDADESFEIEYDIKEVDNEDNTTWFALLKSFICC